MGQRCEFKDLDGSYLPSRQQVMLETASIAGGATIAVFLVVIVCLAVYIHFQRKQKESRASCFVDGSSRDMEEIRPFSRSLAISMTHQQTHPLTVSIFQHYSSKCARERSRVEENAGARPKGDGGILLNGPGHRLEMVHNDEFWELVEIGSSGYVPIVWGSPRKQA
uniref:Uncharacterized protein n=1 Tax=Timema tahoe TaxID=61484 RepID=A0A7R9IKU9_9NEOP|nr:unnamed protein product [Timema tahoe]